MDYHRPLNESASHPKVHIAIVLVPGHNRTDDPMSYGESPLLLNPVSFSECYSEMLAIVNLNTR